MSVMIIIETDKEGLGQEGNPFIVIIEFGDVVWLSGKSIKGRKVFSRDMDKFQVKISKV